MVQIAEYNMEKGRQKVYDGETYYTTNYHEKNIRFHISALVTQGLSRLLPIQ